MLVETPGIPTAKVVALAVLSLLGMSAVPAADRGCEGSNGYSYICGPASAEDLVLIPGTKWVIASGFGGSTSLYLVDSEQKTWSDLYPAGEPRARRPVMVR